MCVNQLQTQSKRCIFLLLSALSGFALSSCSDRNYNTYDECILEESKNIKHKDAFSSVRSLCRARLKQQADENKKTKLVSDPYWIKTYEDKKDGRVTYIDKNSIEIFNGNIRHSWAKSVQSSKSKPNDYFMFKVEFSCASRKIRIWNSSEYKNGDFVQYVDISYDEEIVPGSSAMHSYNYVCNFESD